MKVRVCPICIIISATWLVLQLGILAGVFPLEQVQILIALLMGASVVGIAYQGGQRRIIVIVVGLPLAYWFAAHVTWLNLGIELAILGVVGYLYFILPAKALPNSPRDQNKLRDIEEKLKKCC